MWRSSAKRFSSVLLAPRTNIVHPVNSISSSHLFHSPAEGVSPSVESIKLGLAPKSNSQASLYLALKAQGIAQAIAHYGQCYWELSKARLSMLAVATSGAGFVLASGATIDIAGLCWTCGGTMMVAAAANSLNQVFEIKNDALMKRTRQRPLPSGRLSVSHAAAWASCLGLAGTTILACKANLLTAGLAASNLALYAFLYTPLKQIHPANTWVGAIVGAIPPLLGWAAASGEVSLNGFILPAALYFWQIPHFMALAYLCRNDYAAGGFRMFSLTDASGQRTALVALQNCVYMLPLGFLAYDWGLSSEWFCAESTFLTLILSAAAFSFYRNRTTQKARRMFHASLLYLPVFMAGMLFHRQPNTHQHQLELTESDRSAGHLSVETEVNGFVESDSQDKPNKRPVTFPGAPVSYASIAPFPFLPPPSYPAPNV